MKFKNAYLSLKHSNEYRLKTDKLKNLLMIYIIWVIKLADLYAQQYLADALYRFNQVELWY